ncbi:sulfotransferase [Roseobacteraceae bacterium S113]
MLKRSVCEFMIVGLPRSGTTYLMTLLDSHANVICSGEEFNPTTVIGQEGKDDSSEAVFGRDADPVGHMNKVFAKTNRSTRAIGFKYMIGHNLAILEELERRPDIRLIYVWRENRAAQAISWLKAMSSKRWAQSMPDEHISTKLNVSPRQLSNHWHQFAWHDRMFAKWLSERKNPSLTLEYRELFQPSTIRKCCEFIGVPYSKKLKSPLVRQSTGSILDRLERPWPVNRYFREIGRARWLDEPEI